MSIYLSNSASNQDLSGTIFATKNGSEITFTGNTFNSLESGTYIILIYDDLSFQFSEDFGSKLTQFGYILNFRWSTRFSRWYWRKWRIYSSKQL